MSEAFEENAYIVGEKDGARCVVIDPGLDPDKIISALDKDELTPEAFLVTHGHYDHIGGLEGLKQRWPEVPIVIGKEEASKLTDPMGNLSGMFSIPCKAPPADRLLEDDEAFDAAGLHWQTRLAPGHSKGHLVFLAYADQDDLKQDEPDAVFVGDVIFADSIGRHDFPDGDFNQLATAIRKQIYTLSDKMVLYPGHGLPTTVGRERRTNPFVREEDAS